MKLFFFCAIYFLCFPPCMADQDSTAEDYLHRFQTYQKWSQQLPKTAHPDPAFITFISEDKPLSKKLRERWLYQLAHLKEWSTFLSYYKPSKDIALQCNQKLAYFYTGNQTLAIQDGLKLWLSPTSQPPSCDYLFHLLTQNHWISDDLIQRRIALALDNQNLTMSIFLLNMLSVRRPDEAKQLQIIAQQPKKITTLTQSTFHSELYLFGLKRLVAKNSDRAIVYWRNPKTKQMLNPAQQQSFLAYLSLYKAMRNQADSLEWFQKIYPAYYNDTLLTWEIRFALKHHRWHHVIHLIKKLTTANDPSWQYWLARGYAATGEHVKAHEIYQLLANQRSYYGFLASTQLHQHYHFHNERTQRPLQFIQAYKPITDEIKTLYFSQEISGASRLINDFFLELPKNDKAVLAAWVANDLNWPVKALNLCNNKELANHLNLRFPLTYHQLILPFAKQKNIDPALVYAIIRQESAFRDKVTSSAGAQGLMQLMPQTAEIIARKEHLAYSNKNQLFKARHNIALGIAYLSSLAQNFHAYPLLMVAAYNAGPRQVHNWLKNSPPQEIDIWIETLPWIETRNYLKNVIAFYAVYQYRLGKPATIRGFMQEIG